MVVLDRSSLLSDHPIVEGHLPGSDRTVTSALIGWFEVIVVGPDTEVDACLTDEGRAILAESGLSHRSLLLTASGGPCISPRTLPKMPLSSRYGGWPVLRR